MLTTAARIRGTCALAVLAMLLSSCGGGSGGASASISFSATSISFEAAAPYATPPQTQTITGTVTGVVSGTLYLKVVENNPDVATVADLSVAGNSGQATIVPASPTALLAGTHRGSFTVHACLNDPTCASGELSGSPQTISVTYQIGSSVDADAVMPRIVGANTGGTVILRGKGFTGAYSVSFGTTPASNVSVVSDSEIHASYPPLAAGSYGISIDSGNIAYGGTLEAINPPAFAPAFLSYPASTNASISSVSYDADRNALLVVTGSTLLRYAFDGSAWGAPTQVVINGLQQVSVSPDGTKLLALVALPTPSASMLELDPVTLAQTAGTQITQPSVYDQYFTGAVLGGFAYANDGNAIVWSSVLNSVYVYGTSSRTYALLYNTLGQQIPPLGNTVASGDGSIVMVGLPNDEYVASTETAHTVTTPGHFVLRLTSADLDASEFATISEIVGPEGQLLGNLPGTVGTVINPAGSRLYAIDQADSQPELHTYDLTAAPSGGVYPETGSPITLAGNPTSLGLPDLLALTPDGGTAFIAGPNGIAVQPVSP